MHRRGMASPIEGLGTLPSIPPQNTNSNKKELLEARKATSRHPSCVAGNVPTFQLSVQNRNVG